VVFASPEWSSLSIAGVRIGLALTRGHSGAWTGLHFAVRELARALEAVERSGGSADDGPTEVAPGVVIAEVSDSEANTLMLTLARGSRSAPRASRNN
jgi:hypothetical protein